jgi:predicted metal-binding membrane protein
LRYLLTVTDVTREQALTHLGAAATRLCATLARPRPIALAVIVALTTLGWLALGLLSAAEPLGIDALCGFAATPGSGALALAAAMWAAMTLAMMLPTAGPMILTYAEIADTAARKRDTVVSPLVLAAGYLAVWLGFALAAALLQWMLARAELFESGAAGRLIGGAIFVAAGLYQFSSLKQACLSQCQRPFPFFFANWATEPSGVLRLGLRQGAYCLGCCWAMMLVMFAVGAMNVVWMAALGVLMTMEKLDAVPRLREAVGLAFIAAGLVMVAISAGSAWI